jgi:hypothetical protein
MKRYILTEEQINKIINGQPIKKGIALKIQDDRGEYYESQLKEFNNEEEYNQWKESLDDNTEIIGEMDIEDEVNVVKEQDESKPKDKGLEILTKLIKNKYPFIISIDGEYSNSSPTKLMVDIVFDLNKFYDLTNTTFPRHYVGKDYLIDVMLNEPGFFLKRYVDDENKDKYDYQYNNKMEHMLNNYYKLLPEHLQHKMFEGFTEEDINNDKDPDFIRRWKEEGDRIELAVNKFYPQVDVDKLK